MQTIIQKWVISLFTVAGAFFLCGVGGALIAELFGIWEKATAGFFAAFGVVSMAYLSAPCHNKKYSSVVFIIGSIFAWLLIGESSYPESYITKAYQPTYIPFAVTLAGGLLPLAIILFPSKGSKHEA